MRASEASAGLVLSTTSCSGPIEIDPFHCRALRSRKGLLTSGRLLDEAARRNGFRTRAWFVTLTYRDGVDWAPRQVSAMFNHLRAWCRARGVVFRAQWCLELTRRMRPHYHVIVWLPARLALPKADKRGWWPHGMTQTVVARSPVGYLAKYASKFTPDCMAAMPKGARVSGVSGLEPEAAREVRWWKAPAGARELLGGLADIRVAPGGRVDRVSGAFWRSPWRVTVDGGGRVFVQKVAEYTNAN